MEKEKHLAITYKYGDIVVVIDSNYYMSTFVHISCESAGKGTGSISLTKEQAARLLTILSAANEEAEI